MISTSTTQSHGGTKRLALLAALLGLVALVLSYLNYPLMLFGTEQVASALWFGSLGLAAIAALLLASSFLRFAWLAFQRRCSPLAPITVLLVCGVIAVLWGYYFRFLERMP